MKSCGEVVPLPCVQCTGSKDLLVSLFEAAHLHLLQNIPWEGLYHMHYMPSFLPEIMLTSIWLTCSDFLGLKLT